MAESKQENKNQNLSPGLQSLNDALDWWESFWKKIPSGLSKFMAFLKFILHVLDDLVPLTKNVLGTSVRTSLGVVGSIFYVLTGYMAYEAIRDFIRDLVNPNQEQRASEEEDDEEALPKVSREGRIWRMRRNGINALLFLGGSGLAVALMLSAWTDLLVVGAPIFPFAIAVALLVASFNTLINWVWDYYDSKNNDKEEVGRAIYYQLIDFVSFGIITVGLAIMTFLPELGEMLLFSGLPFFTVPLVIVVFGAFIGIAGKIFEHHLPEKFGHWMSDLSDRCYPGPVDQSFKNPRCTAPSSRKWNEPLGKILARGEGGEPSLSSQEAPGTAGLPNSPSLLSSDGFLTQPSTAQSDLEPFSGNSQGDSSENLDSGGKNRGGSPEDSPGKPVGLPAGHEQGSPRHFVSPRPGIQNKVSGDAALASSASLPSGNEEEQYVV